MSLPTETELRIREHLARIQDEFIAGTKVLLVIDQSYLEYGVMLGEVSPERAISIIQRQSPQPAIRAAPPIARAVNFLRALGKTIEPADVPGLYKMDGLELTTNQVIEVATKAEEDRR